MRELSSVRTNLAPKSNHSKRAPPIEKVFTPHAHGEEGEGNWLVSYADMMTLLVGFFVILLSFSTIDDGKLEEIRKSLSQQFGGTYQVPYGEIVDRLREALGNLGLGEQVAMKQTDLGVEISFLGTVFFDTGSAELKAEAKTLLSQLIPIIQAEKSTFDITIEGHTDDVPVSHGVLFRNNWELSSLRACRVLDAFLGAGFAKEALTAVGFADARPVAKNRDENGAAIAMNQAQNRRVVIKLIRKEASVITDTTKDSNS